ncbi:hypothetical protein IWW37_000525 [Coemansia sp. RSA 2050]|nr:hypothetical protein IWW37_000525 [Coemansia sp. RSA 2050]
MTFVDDIDLLLPILSADNSCLGESGSGACLDGLKLSTIFGTDTPPLYQPHSQGAQLDPAFPTGDGSEPNHTAQQAAEKPLGRAMKNVDPISIQYTEKEKRERKYECQYCHKRFSRPSSLTSHVYTHTGERPFACDFIGCSKRFSVLSNLRRHYKVHSSRRAYGGVRPQNTSFHSSIYASTIPSRGYNFGASAAGFAEPNRPIPASFALLQEHPAMRSDYSMLAPASREPYSSSIALQSRPSSINKAADYPSFGTGGYAPSFRTTASALSLPESFEASLLVGLAGEQLTAATGYQGPRLAGSNSGSSNLSSPTSSSNHVLCRANLGPSSSDGHIPAPTDNDFAPASQFDAAITDSQFAAMFGRLPTEHKFGNSDTSGAGGSDSDNSSDHIPAAADARLLSLDGQGHRAASPDTLDVFIKAITVGSNGNKTCDPLSEFFPRSPRIATQTILTNTSVTTKAMNGAIDPVGSASQDLTMLFSLGSTKSAPLGLVDLPPPPRHQPSLLQANGPALMSTGAKLLGSIGGMAASHVFAESGAADNGTNDVVWQVLHTSHSHDS